MSKHGCSINTLLEETLQKRTNTRIVYDYKSQKNGRKQPQFRTSKFVFSCFCVLRSLFLEESQTIGKHRAFPFVCPLHPNFDDFGCLHWYLCTIRCPDDAAIAAVTVLECCLGRRTMLRTVVVSKHSRNTPSNRGGGATAPPLNHKNVFCSERMHPCPGAGAVLCHPHPFGDARV